MPPALRTLTFLTAFLILTGLAANLQAQNELWSYTAESSQGITAPVYDDGKIFFTEANHVEAVDAETGDQLWRNEIFLGEFSPAPAAAGGMVYVVGDDGNATAFDAETGEEEWVYEAGYQIRSPPRVVDGTLYFGTYWRDSKVYAIDAETGEEEWTHDGPSSDILPIEVVDGTVYAGSYDLNLYAELYAIDTDGTTEWVFDIDNAEISLIDVADNTVYTTDGTVVYAIDAESGDAEWEIEIEDGARQVVHDNGNLYFSYDGEVLALDVETQEKLWRVDVDPSDSKSVSPVEPAGDFIYVGSEGEEAVHQLDAETGEELWRFDADWEVSVKPTLVDQVLYAMSRNGVLHAIDVGDGEPVSSETGPAVPDDFALNQNYPNPFNPKTVISFNLPEAGNVRLEVMDVLGRRVAILVDEVKQSGQHEVIFDASQLSSGTYIYRLEAGEFSKTRKMMFVK